MSKNAFDLSGRVVIADAVAMVLRVECGESEAAEVEDLLELLKQWKSGTIHGRAPALPLTDPGSNIDTQYG